MRFSPLFLLLVLCLTGCGPSGYNITGTVTYDGAPVDDGDILFKPKDPSIGPAMGKIKNGKYVARVQAGPHVVEIRASKMMPLPAGKKGAMGETELPEQFIIAKYNEKSELSADISGGMEKNFDLKSK